MPHTLEQAAERAARDQGWRKAFTPEELEAAWRRFVAQCKRGYSMDIYEYENDRYCRTMIQEIIEDPALGSDPTTKEFKERISRIDDQFRRLLQPGVLIGDADSPWWERGVPRCAGAELASDFRDTYGVSVEVAQG